VRLLLVAANTERLNMPTLPVGLAQVAGAAGRAGHLVDFLDLMFQPDPLDAVGRAIESTRPELIGISIRNIDDQDIQNQTFLLEKARGVVNACRLGEVPVVLGGPGYSIFPREALKYLGADMGIAADGEGAFCSLIERLETGSDLADLAGLYLPGREGIDPDFSRPLSDCAVPVEYLGGCADPANPDIWVPVQSRRGCPNACSYCSTFLIQGKTIRSTPPELVVEGVERLAQRGFHRFFFVDNSFNIPRAHALELCRLLRQLKPPVAWRCILYPEKVDEDLVEAMARAGCCQVSLGFESGDERVLEQMNKRFSPGDVRHTVDLLAHHGIQRLGFLLLGGPGETRQSVERSLAFADSLGLEGLRTTIGLRIYPHTPLEQRAIEDGIIERDRDLLRPRFYLAPALDPWIFERVMPGMHRREEK